MTLRDALNNVADRLTAVSTTPRLDAELLAAHALGIERDELLLGRLDGAVPIGFESLVQRRLAHEPIAYIVGRRDFWTISLAVGPDVLVPRPDSETLLESAIAHFRARQPTSILDLGTGSGALLLAALAEWPDATGIGIDRSQAALAVAQANALECGLSGRARFQCGSWGNEVQGEQFDLILCNPPYIESGAVLSPEVAEYEPAEALFAGPDGLADYRQLAPQIGPLLNEDGCACVEIGHAQAAAAGKLFENEGLNVVVRQDLGGRDRCLILTKKP